MHVPDIHHCVRRPESRYDTGMRKIVMRPHRSLPRLAHWATILLLTLLWMGPALQTIGAEPAHADPVRSARAAHAHTVPRKVLALFHGQEEPSPDQTRIHKYLEMPLNHLGYEVEYWDLAKGLPTAARLQGVAGAVTWFEDDIPRDADYLQWATKAAKGGLRFVVFESLGGKDGRNEVKLVSPLLHELGLDAVDHYNSKTEQTKVRTVDTTVVATERPLPSPLTPHRYIRVAPGEAGKRVEVLLSASAPGDLPGATADAVLVAAGPGGGYVASGYAVIYDATANRVWWLIDPIAFLSKALDPGLVPLADTTTIAGRRIYFSHIDGDSWNSISQVARYAGRKTINAEVVLNELIAPFPDLPVTIGLISCDVDPSLKGKPGAEDIARKLYALPQVEGASHTHTHPFDWKFFEKYARLDELAKVRKLEEQKVKYGFLPRYSVERPFELTSEVPGSLAAVQRLMPPGKRPQVYLWSGDTKPFEAAVRASRAAGVRNLNGGDTRYDAQWPSLAYVKPLSRMVGAERQIYAVNSNENTYTNEWTGPFDGFKSLNETHDRTESPRRLKPMNVYYHMYSGENDGALGAVRGHLERARAAPVIPVPASRYAAIADSFFEVAFRTVGPRRWRVENRGALQTVRFDRADKVAVDFGASKGVIGQNRANGSLYVALDPAEALPVVALMDLSKVQHEQPHIVESRWEISGIKSAACEVDASARGFGAGEMTWAGVPQGRYWMDVTPGGSPGAPPTRITGLIAGSDGILKARIDADARNGLSFRLVCAN